MGLKDELLRVPTSPRTGNVPATAVTMKLEAGDGQATLELRAPKDQPPTEGEARTALEENGLNPEEWAVKTVRTSSWTMANGEEGTSRRFQFVPTTEDPEVTSMVNDLIETVNALPTGIYPPVQPEPRGAGVIVALGDMQFGKEDGEDDTVENSVERTIRLIDAAAAQVQDERPDKPHVLITWLGDHIEGFVSQGGASAWRTKLTLNEQIRLLRRIMLYTVQQFAPLASKLIVVAVPGNHGEPQRFMGTGITRYDDSHDTEALIATMEACQMRPDLFGHVEFFVPDTDELTVVTEIAGTKVLCAHGHKARIGKAFEWWKGQSFHGNAGADAHLLLTGHYHTFLVDTEGKKMHIQVPALETESTWFRHMRGVTGNPGILLISVFEGQLLRIEAVR